ncbi:hypothetical protein L3V82_10270 [Thiotrichales bacterium 19S3-7]|nr:hypothetical protein [Thiotrichales bacterium 19S3-7]MCF6802541.1 hypothetical protein [Thiotrichales bacterium 19S3-11]
MEQFNFNVEVGLMSFLNRMLNSAIEYLLDNRQFKKVDELRDAINGAYKMDKLSLSYGLFLISEMTETSLEALHVKPHHFGLILQSELSEKGY